MNNLVNDFIDSPPFGLYDIFNFLICHSTSYDKQGLAAYKSFDVYRLFEDGYVESLLTKTLTNERLHVYVGSRHVRFHFCIVDFVVRFICNSQQGFSGQNIVIRLLGLAWRFCKHQQSICGSFLVT